ncbi:MAG: cobA [Paenibacillaceae bacterium]|jgi:uroporphyrinogen III methyltransferase/synthase|nr:cobA [Paenibacillaceae bacterium]
MNRGKVYLTGAGPGDPDLITVKGLESIRRADVIVYDRLISPRLLENVAPHATVIYAGKAPGNHTLTQDEINALLAEKALKGYTVTRLKGGDPFVFGRGGEEALYLQERGIPFEIVPGITSAVAVPAYAGIPVTHRHVASSFLVVTGHECSSKPESSVNWKLVAAVDTVVFLMGIGHLSSITEQLMAHGKPAETPIALIRQGTCVGQETWIGTLQDILAKQRGAMLESPVTIVVGEVVKLREKLAWFDREAASVFAGSG